MVNAAQSNKERNCLLMACACAVLLKMKKAEEEVEVEEEEEEEEEERKKVNANATAGKTANDPQPVNFDISTACVQSSDTLRS